MIKPFAIDHIVLRTDRCQELVDFYCNVLGCSVERVLSEEFKLTQLRAGTALIDIIDVIDIWGELGTAGNPPQMVGKNMDHFCLQIEPFDESEVKAHLQAHGVACGEFQDRYGAHGMGRSLYLQDPVGNQIELRTAVHSGQTTPWQPV